jgi:hypothetical protein
MGFGVSRRGTRAAVREIIRFLDEVETRGLGGRTPNR